MPVNEVLLDWANKYGYMTNNIGYHLASGKPTAEVIVNHLNQLSWEILLDDIRLHIQQFPSHDIELEHIWTTIPNLISVIKSYVRLPHSEHLILLLILHYRIWKNQYILICKPGSMIL